MSDSLAVIVPTANRVQKLIPTLQSLEELRDMSFETLVVQNGLQPDLSANQELERQFAGINLRILYDEVPGLLSGRHRGYRESDAEILLFVDDDVSFAPTWLESIRSVFEDPSTILAGGPSAPSFESTPPDWMNGFWNATEFGGRMMAQLSLIELNVPEPTEIDPGLIWGLNYAIRRSAMTACGGFHPDCVPEHLQHFQGDGETGLSDKVAACGGKAVYHPEAKVFHRIGAHRLTKDYFDKRHFYQGICDSYTKLRNNLEIDPPKKQRSLRQGVWSLAGRLMRSMTTDQNQHDSLATRFSRAYQRGYEFHQRCVAASPVLHDWVKRDSYFDYRYPHLESDLVLPKRQVHEV